MTSSHSSCICSAYLTHAFLYYINRPISLLTTHLHGPPFSTTLVSPKSTNKKLTYLLLAASTTRAPYNILLDFEMEIGNVFIYILLFVPILLACLMILVKHKRKSPSAKLPPGSMGWPYIGETLELYSQNPNDFFATKQKRFFLTLVSCSLICFCV